MLNKLRKLRENKEGFTIIEVVIVLAIAGLIFAIVFVAVPQLQASQRDTTRRSDAGRIAAGVVQWSSNNNGALPSQAQFEGSAGSGQVVMGGIVEDVSQYDVVTTVPDEADQVQYVTGGDCDGTGGSRAFHVTMGLEDGTAYCVDG